MTALLTQIDTETLSNQNISAALLVSTFTNTTRIRKVAVNVFADQVAGGGDYEIYCTIQRAGAGSAYKSPVTTVTVAASVTAVVFPSIFLMLNATDVLKTYIKGLAGDTTTPDIIVDVNEELPLADGAIVAATFGAGAIDAAAIADNAIDAGAIAANAITAAKIADGAIDAATFAAGAIDAAAIADSALDALTFTAVICTGTVGSGSTTTSIVCSAITPASTVNDQFVGRIIIFDRATTTAALRGQATDITAWVHATTTATVTALTTAPVSGDTFHVL